ncbi:MAG: abortive infection family protein [Candidatus Altiarchaeia archaeon]
MGELTVIVPLFFFSKKKSAHDPKRKRGAILGMALTWTCFIRVICLYTEDNSTTMIHKNLFSIEKRRKEGKTDFYTYDTIPVETRRKIFYLIRKIFDVHPGYSFWFDLRTKIVQQYGILELYNNENETRDEAIHYYMVTCEVDHFLDCIQLCLYLGQENLSKSRINLLGASTYVSSFKDVTAFIQDTNDIFQLDKIGYEIIRTDYDFLIVRTDSKYLHQEVVKNALNLLEGKGFEAPLMEFEKALGHYTKKNYPEAITYANSSFESVMKVILSKDTGDATQLIKDLMAHKRNGQPFLPPYYESLGVQLKNLLQCLPVTRNEKGADHGKGLKEVVVDKSYAEFAIHLSGTFIVFLIHHYRETT